MASSRKNEFFRYENAFLHHFWTVFLTVGPNFVVCATYSAPLETFDSFEAHLAPSQSLSFCLNPDLLDSSWDRSAASSLHSHPIVRTFSSIDTKTPKSPTPETLRVGGVWRQTEKTRAYMRNGRRHYYWKRCRPQEQEHSELSLASPWHYCSNKTDLYMRWICGTEKLTEFSLITGTS